MRAVHSRLVYTSDGIGITSGRSLTIVCKSKKSRIGSATESEGSEGFLYLPTPLLLQSLTILHA